MTPLEMALCMMNQHILWTPQLSLPQFLSKIDDQKILLNNIGILVGKSTNVRELLFKFAHQGKVVELAALLLSTARYDASFSIITYIPATYLPPDNFVQAPVMLCPYVCCIISALVKKGFHLPGKEGENCSNVMSQMTTVMKLLESARRGELAHFKPGQPLTVEDSCGIPKESQGPLAFQILIPK
ncbi:hypothetical protein POM88_003165 [Heracleum sosnowskyi]|uniref:Uncharacterized protein n=1 Tax=Heracleum sosnowskyi TaxID=360622 RepID=A0AAD8N6M2_9APIA|nr:hypothetical protein POM88_003165 [Heracleum sosnowskyi]